MKAEWSVKGIYKADAQKVADEIGESKITPEELLEKAKDENTELHKCFEWNDAIAAPEAFRLSSFGGFAEGVGTLRAAYELGRSAYGFEIDRNFYERAKNEMLVFEKDNQMSIFDIQTGSDANA